MANPMKIRATAVDGGTEVKILMAHEMETGQRKDASGNIIPAWYITDVFVTHNQKVVMKCQFGTGISKNPFLGFKFKGGTKGDKIIVNWTDNKGDKRTDETVIA